MQAPWPGRARRFFPNLLKPILLPMTFETLLVALSLREHDSTLVQYAGMLARRIRPQRILFAHVAAGAGEAKAAERRMREAVRGEAEGFGGAELGYAVAEGTLLDALLDASRESEADLVLVGKGHGAVQAERLARKAPCSVLVVPPGAPPTLRRILASVDFSAHAATAARTAAALAGAEAELHLVHAYSAPGDNEALREAAKARAEEDYAAFLRDADVPEARRHLRPADDAPAAIEAQAAEIGADLIVIGTRGRSPGAAVLLGSVAEELVRDAATPLLAVKPKGATLRLLDALVEEHWLSHEPPGPDRALDALVRGNRRFAISEPVHPRFDMATRARLASGQRPFAIVLACVDSRVPPELVFDRGLGDLLVIRTAGNVLDEVAMGSIEFGVSVLKSPLLMVLGHDRCGAVEATCSMLERGERAPGSIQALVDRIAPAVAAARETEGALLPTAIRCNVHLQMQTLMGSEIIREAIREGRLQLAGGVYDLHTGEVEMLPPLAE